MARAPNWRFALLLTAAISVAAVLLLFPEAVARVFSWVERDNIAALVDRAGAWGPVVIIMLMTGAVVFSPIPSAPIALASGAAYGHYKGGIYVVIGAEAGALIAFWLARVLGRDAIQRWFGDKLSGLKFLGSQNMLMWLVFVSRLMPFMSFDLVSYAAGLSRLSFWRFAIATLAGIIPASFLLAHFGGEMAQGGLAGGMWLALGLGLVTGAPVVWAMIKGKGTGQDHREK